MDDGKKNRVGWIDPKNRALIWHSWYEKGHITPQWSLKLFQIDKVVTNYESLSTDDRARITSKAYNDAKDFLDVKESTAKVTNVDPSAEPKN